MLSINDIMTISFTTSLACQSKLRRIWWLRECNIIKRVFDYGIVDILEDLNTIFDYGIVDIQVEYVLMNILKRLILYENFLMMHWWMKNAIHRWKNNSSL